jgi:hypothetical protein
MRRDTGLLLAVAFLLFPAAANAQASPPSDPYKNFVGQWFGKILIDRDNLPQTVQMTVTEEKNGHGMRWDYVFGTDGQKGFKRATKTIVLKPAEEKAEMHFLGSPKQIYLTLGLHDFAQNGAGQFSASDCSTRGRCSICTFDLERSSLSYQWKTTNDGKRFDVYSEFVFTRGVEPVRTRPNSPVTVK